MTTTNVFYPENIAPITSFDGNSTISCLENAIFDGSILTGIVKRYDKNGDLWFTLGSIRGVIPHDEFEFLTPDESSRLFTRPARVGQKTCFKVLGFYADESGDTIAILSRREAQKECFESYARSLNIGETVSACVTSVAHCGVFVDIGCGVCAMIPWSELSIARYSNKTTSFKVGDFIYAVVSNVDENTHKICLNTKVMFGTWQENAANFNEGYTVNGTVVSKIDDGWQVALAPNFVGIIRECDGVNLFRGQSVRVTVQRISYDSAEIRLSLEKVCGKKIAKHINFTKHYVPLSTDFRHWDYYAPSDASYSDIEAA